MLEDSANVRAIQIDFTKAFDIADHTVLMYQLAEYNFLVIYTIG